MTKYSRPSTVSTSLMIDCGDVQIDAIGTYDAESGCLESVTINKRVLPLCGIFAALNLLCHDDAGPWDDDLDGYTLNVLLTESGDDASAEHGENSGE